jgi:hypothetical protein
MISMNWMPPRAIDTSRPATLPAVNSRILNSDSRNIGSATRVSMTRKISSTTSPPMISPSTTGDSQPIELFP